MVKTCIKCGTEKPVGMFYRNKSKRDGRNTYCNSCEYKYKSEYLKKRGSGYRHLNNLKRNYGMSVFEYNLILSYQKGVCSICKCSPISKKLCVDHNHKTGSIRGLLCDNCNHGLGKFKDLPVLLRNAADYLEEYSE